MARKPGNGGAVFLWFLMFVVLGLAGSEFYGPTKGWMRPTVSTAKQRVSHFQNDYAAKQERDRIAAEERAKREGYKNPFGILQGDVTAFEEPAGEPVDSTQPATTGTDPTPAVATTPKFDVQTIIEKYPPEQLIPSDKGYAAIHTEIWQAKLATLEGPEVGRSYNIRTRGKDQFEGNLLVLTPDRVVLKNDLQPNQTFLAKNLSMRSLKQLFPERYAKKFAQYHMAKALRASGIKITPPKPDPATTSVALKTPQPDIAEVKPPGSGEPTATTLPRLTDYEPSYARTPRSLGPPLKEYHAWLDYQNRRLKYRLATKLYAKQHGKSIVLYMETSKSFRLQPREAREVYCDSFWKMWARKLREQGRVGDEADAHLVLLDDHGNIVGGSKVKNSGDTWVK